jgi:hypothetical protein
MSNGLIILHEESPYLIHTTSRVASVAVALTPVLTADRIHVHDLERGFGEHLADLAIYRTIV